MKVVISGASSGIGLALARHYLERGATVGAFARRGELLKHLADEFPGRVFAVALDVRDAPALQAAAHDFIALHGAPDLVIANAGVSCGTLTDSAEDELVFQDIMDINVLGMMKTFQPFLAPMRAAGRGTLAGIASVAGFRGLPGSGAYSASKAAAIAYLESLRVDLRGSGIGVVTICPGYIKTPMTDVNTFPMPFIIEANDAARRIARVIARGGTFAVVPWQMAWIGRILKLLPNPVYDLAFSHAPRKPRSHR
jgi:NAD(P)-dependent dehydrogenase (short-subunit alcohol dehydrogenase family)